MTASAEVVKAFCTVCLYFEIMSVRSTGEKYTKKKISQYFSEKKKGGKEIQWGGKGGIHTKKFTNSVRNGFANLLGINL